LLWHDVFSANAGGSGGLTDEAKIGLGVGLGLFFLIIIIIIIIVCCCCKILSHYVCMCFSNSVNKKNKEPECAKYHICD